ncbi:Uncharacterised protein [Staphylococcus saprophyticus]|nr:Uncharacterised protein [Staphylococcus saprophyticus]
MMPMKPQFEYVVYKGDEIICAGTKAECAQKLGITEQSVAHLGTGAYKRSLKKRNLDEGNAMIVEKVLISEIEAEKVI